MAGSWQLCQAAVEAVLKGAPITPIASEAAREWPRTADKSIRNSTANNPNHESSLSHQPESPVTAVLRGVTRRKAVMDGESRETESMISEETVGASRLFPAVPEFGGRLLEGSGEIGLELTLGFKPVVSRGSEVVVPVKKRRVEVLEDSQRCKVELGLDYPAA
ncbi:hypothetical protein F3Y22_tig00113338pilonHSYRG00081 [Hibiscus syriacus]|uniref:Uncharacterized protein n=1 Tax=Hibiscus syriacus TaxID=106335 RepID=A0A6A2X5L4_HIBSY|nr:hypothetical protein F3Y22_tig00113338pilonHSYRG00081 [Hibiscus syriacus]